MYFLIILNFVGIKLLPEYKNRHVTSARVEPPGQTDFKFAFRGWASPPPNPWPLASVWRERFLHQQSCDNPITFAFMIRLISLLISIPRNTNHQIHVKKEIKDMKILFRVLATKGLFRRSRHRRPDSARWPHDPDTSFWSF